MNDGKQTFYRQAGILPSVMICWILLFLYAVPASAGERLYNGIQLPDIWPPNLQALTYEPMPVPYLEDPPSVIPIDVGRQLFVDDFLIDNTTCSRTFHKAQWHPDPILVPDRPWESPPPSKGGASTAMPFSDGVFYDPADKLYKMWYFAAWGMYTCYAYSEDGFHWEKPELDVVPGTNIVMDHTQTEIDLDFTNGRDSATVWLDHNANCPDERFKMLCRDQGAGDHNLFFSADGIHWDGPQAATGAAQDRTTFFYNPFRMVWGLSLRSTVHYHPDQDAWHYGIKSPNEPDKKEPWVAVRIRRYAEGPDLISAARSWPRLGKPKWWNFERGREMALVPTVWVGADRLDPVPPDSKFDAQLYHLDATAYESLMVGLFSVLRSDDPVRRAKITNVCVGFSRDGFHWDRTFRQPIIDVSDDAQAWNAFSISSTGGGFLVVGDELRFYCSARAGGTPKKRGDCTTGMATMRRDGFASMDAPGRAGSLTTRPVRFSGKYLMVNLAAPQGELRVEVLDADGNLIEPYSQDNCTAIRGDHTKIQVQWKKEGQKVADLSGLAGKPVRFRFLLENGSLYAFWVSPESSGASSGYVAAGGPGFTGLADTAGAQK